MKKYLFLLLLPLVLFLSCVNNVEETSYNPGNVTVSRQSLTDLTDVLASDASLNSDEVNIRLTVLDSNNNKVREINNITTTFGIISDDTTDVIQVSGIPYGHGYKLHLSVFYNGVEIYEGSSKEPFDITEESKSKELDIDISPITFTIKYVLNGKEKPNNYINSYTFTSLITLETLMDSSKKFSGWYDNKDFTGSPIKVLGRANTLGNVTLYGTWDNIKCSINYIVDNNTIKTKTVDKGYSLTSTDLQELSISEKNNTTFKGWYLNDEYHIPSGYVVEDNLTLVARYNIVGSTQEVTFKPTPTVKSLDKGSKIVLSTLTDKAVIYYTLDGSDPKTSKDRLVYIDPISLDTDTITIKAYAKNPSFTESKTTSATYTMKKYNVVLQNPDKSTYKELPSLTLGYALTEKDLEPLPDTNDYTFICWTSGGREIRVGEKVSNDMTLTPSVRHIGKVSDVTYKGVLEEGKEITLETQTPRATIYYTTDGSSPLDATGKRVQYSTPILLGSDVLTIQAIAVKQGLDNSNLTYINYTPTSYTVTFDCGGKGKTPSPVNGLKKGEGIPSDRLVALTETGYNFVGWEDSNGKVVDSSYKVQGNTTVSAKWTLINYDIIKDGVKDGTYTIEDTVTLTPLTKDGYDFAGWLSNGIEISVIKKGSTGKIELTSNFIPITYKITYHNVSNITETLPSSYTIESGPINLPPISKEGYTFDGWYTDELCSPSNKKESINTGSTGNLNLYPKWISLNTVKSVSFDQKEGLLDYNSEIRLSCTTPSSTIYYTTDEKALKKDFIQYTTPIKLTTDKLVVRAYATKKGLSDSEISKAIYNTKYYTVTFDNDGKGGCPLPISNLKKGDKLPAESIKPLVADGFEFSNWIDSNKNNVDSSYTVTNDTVITAVWTPWGAVSDVVISPSSGAIDYNTPITLTCSTEGSTIYYTTDGRDPTDTNNKTRKVYSPTSNILLTQDNLQINACSEKNGLYSSSITSNNYSMKKYDVYFNNKGKGTAVKAIKGLKKGDTIPSSSLAPLTQKGYNFIHWEDSKNKGTAITSDYAVTSTITLEAKWEAISYNLNLDNEGSVTNSKFTIEDNILFTDPSTQKEGYRFIGWYDSKNVDAVKVEGIKKGDTGDKTLYAKYQVIDYNVNYLNSDEPSITYNIEMTSPIQLPTPTIKDGKRFDGWFKTSDYVGSPITEIPVGSHEHFNLYARWTALNQTSPVTFTKAHDLNDLIELSCTTPSSTIYYTTDNTDPRTSTTKQEYTVGIPLDKNNLIINAYATCPNFSDSELTRREYKVGTYKCTFLSRFGSIPSQNVAYSSKLSAPIVSHEGYTLEGWGYFDGVSEAPKEWDFATDTMPKKDLELFAMWLPISYNITFNPNGVSALTEQTNPYDYDQSFSMPTFNIDMVGHTLKWTTQIDGTGTTYELNTMYKNLCTTQDETLVLYAQYKPIKYKVQIYTDLSSTTAPEIVEYNYGDFITLPTDLQREGYIFNYSFIDEETNTVYKAGYNIRNLTTQNGKTVVLKPQFTNLKPSPVANVKVLEEDKKVTLSWDNPTEADFKEVKITSSANPDGLIVPSSQSSAVISNLLNNTKYDFTIVALDNEGLASDSVVVSSFANPLQQFTGTLKELPKGTNGTAGSTSSYVEFGYWPQSLKEDNVDILENEPIYVNGLLKAYLGNDNNYYVKEKSSSTIGSSSTFKNGTPIAASTTYYYKVEPIKWRVLPKEPTDSGLKLFSEVALDYQLYSKESMAMYEGCTIDNYLNYDFLEKAFNDEAKNDIVPHPYIRNPRPVSLISHDEMMNQSYFEASFNIHREATDYSISKGAPLVEGFITKWATNTITGSDVEGFGKINITEPINASYGVVPIIHYGKTTLKSLSFPKIGVKNRSAKRTEITTRIFGTGLSKSDVLENITVTSLDYSISSRIEKESANVLKLIVNYPPRTGTFNVTVSYKDLSVNGQIVVTDYPNTLAGNLLLNDDTIVMKEDIPTLDQASKDKAVGLFYGCYSEYGAPLLIGLAEGSNKKFSAGRKCPVITQNITYEQPVTNLKNFTSDDISDSDGSDNWDLTQAYDCLTPSEFQTYYEAYAYISQYAQSQPSLTGKYATGWYAPTLNEIVDLWWTLTTPDNNIQDSLTKMGYSNFDFSNANYFTSNMGEGTEPLAAVFSFSQTTAYVPVDTVIEHIRPIRQF